MMKVDIPFKANFLVDNTVVTVYCFDENECRKSYDNLLKCSELYPLVGRL